MKYMLLIYGAETAINADQRRACMVKSTAVCHDLAAKGQLIDASPLHPVATATSVRLREGHRIVTDGPFAETVEQLGGYYIIDVPDLDAAIAVAAQLPPAGWGTVEIRPIEEVGDLTETSADNVADATAARS